MQAALGPAWQGPGLAGKQKEAACEHRDAGHAGDGGHGVEIGLVHERVLSVWVAGVLWSVLRHFFQHQTDGHGSGNRHQDVEFEGQGKGGIECASTRPYRLGPTQADQLIAALPAK